VSRHVPAIQTAGGAGLAPERRADIAIRAAAGVTVAVLAGIAAAISYSHMRELAAAHGQTGWQAHTFPLSVDGIEIVASLVLLADRRTGRASGWLPWAALAAGTAASLAANVAAAGADLVGRVIAGWPAFALLVAIKLLSQMLEPRPETDRPTVVDDRAVPASDRPHAVGTTGDGPGTAAGPLPVPPVTAANGHRATSILPSPPMLPGPSMGTRRVGPAGDGDRAHYGPGMGRGPGSGTIWRAQPAAGTGTPPGVASLLPAARAARDRLAVRGDALTRDTLAAQLRRDGHAVRNTKVSQLLVELRKEAHAAPDSRARAT